MAIESKDNSCAVNNPDFSASSLRKESTPNTTSALVFFPSKRTRLNIVMPSSNGRKRKSHWQVFSKFASSCLAGPYSEANEL